MLVISYYSLQQRSKGGSFDLFLEDNNTTKQLIFKTFHCHREVNDTAQRTDLITTEITYQLPCRYTLMVYHFTSYHHHMFVV